MVDRNSFTETLRAVSEIIRTSPEPLSKDEILSYFKDMELGQEQKDMIFEYLLAPHDEEPQENSETEEPEKEEPKEDEGPRALELYVDELGGIEDIDDEKLSELYEKLLEGDESVMEDIIKANLKMVAGLAADQDYENVDVAPEDLIQEGNIGMLLRLRELCGMGSGCEYDIDDEIAEAALEAMKSYISEFCGEEDREKAVAGKINVVTEAQKYLTEHNGHAPTTAELAEYTMLSEEEVCDILALKKK